MTTRKRRLVSTLWAVPLGLLVVCGGPGHDPGPQDVPDTASGPPSVSYHLTWIWGEAEAVPSGWEVTNDLGFTIRITAGWLTTYSVQLVPCPEEGAGIRSTLGRLLAPAIAHAGHGGASDPSAITTTHLENLTVPGDTVLGPVIPGSQRYCQVHYLVGPAEDGAVGLPGEPDLMDASLYLEGTWGAPGAAPTTPFVVWSSLPMGAQRPLVSTDVHGEEDAAFALDTGVSSAKVTIQRDLGGLFDGVDFEAMDDLGIQKKILQSATAHLEITVERH